MKGLHENIINEELSGLAITERSNEENFSKSI
jgi:hypothetical protein